MRSQRKTPTGVHPTKVVEEKNFEKSRKPCRSFSKLSHVTINHLDNKSLAIVEAHNTASNNRNGTTPKEFDNGKTPCYSDKDMWKSQCIKSKPDQLKDVAPATMYSSYVALVKQEAEYLAVKLNRATPSAAKVKYLPYFSKFQFNSETNAKSKTKPYKCGRNRAWSKHHRQ